jgi:Tfp pilus assembly protein PilE
MNLQLVVIVIGLLATIATSMWGIHVNNARSVELKADLKAEISTLKADLKAEIAALRADVRMDINRLDTRLNSIQAD